MIITGIKKKYVLGLFDYILIFLCGYLMFCEVIKTVFNITLLHYLTYGLAFILTFLILIDLKSEISLALDSVLAIVILFLSFIVTSANMGIISGVEAVTKSIMLVWGCLLLSITKVSVKTLRIILNMIMVFAIISVIYACIKDNAIGNIQNMTNVYSKEVTSFWSNKNSFGRFLFLSVPCTVVLCRLYKSKPLVYFAYIIIALVLTLCVVLSFSRAALLGVIVFWGLYILLNARENLLKYSVIAIVALGVLIVLLLNSTIFNFVKDYILRFETAGLSERDTLWEIGLRYIKENPILGSGEFATEELIIGAHGHNSDFHNEYISIMVMNGIPSFLMYAVIIGKRLYLLFVLRKKNTLLNISISCIIALLFYMFFESFRFFNFALDGLIVVLIMYSLSSIKEFGIKPSVQKVGERKDNYDTSDIKRYNPQL